jgi:hypothetical protein
MDFPNSTMPSNKKRPVYATENQKDYINGMLDEIGGDLSEYTDTDIADLTVGEASEIIDELKDIVEDYRFDQDY